MESNKEEMIKNTARIRMLEARIQALINILEQEGVCTNDEVDKRVREILEMTDD